MIQEAFAGKTYRRSLLAVVAAVFAVALLPATSLSGNPNPGVLPPQSEAFGMTYAEWSAKWWQWAVSMPLDHNPLADTADCSAGQIGTVWFLGGYFSPFPPPLGPRECNVPAGKALFFPIANSDCSTLEAPPFFGATPEARLACVREIVDTLIDLSAEIDGVPVEDLTIYRATSPDFHFVAPDNNLLGVPGGSGEMTADGYYLLLAPLPAGQHTIHFGGTFPLLGFAVDETYHLTVGK